MKKLMRGAAMSLALVLSAQAAQAQAGLSLGLGAGAVIPSGTMADGNGTGWTGQASLRVKPAVSPLGFQLDGFYTRFGLEGVDGHSRLIGSTANMVYAFPSASTARPYLIGGLGLYNGKTSVDGLGSSDAQTKFGANAGAGFDLKVGSAALFAEGRFHAIFKGVTDGQTAEEKTAYMIPLTVGLRWSLR